MARNLKNEAVNIAEANHYAASPAGIIEAQLAIEEKLKITRPAHLSAPAAKKKKTVTVEVDAE